MGLVKVMVIPRDGPGPRPFHFAGGTRVAFTEVDWFRDDYLLQLQGDSIEQYRKALTNHVKARRYYDEHQAFLVLAEFDTFTINYKAP